MSSFRGWVYCAGLAVLLNGIGCRSAPSSAVNLRTVRPIERVLAGFSRPDHNRESKSHRELSDGVKKTDSPDLPEIVPASASLESLADHDELSLEILVAAVIERNPTMHAAQAAWGAAAHRYPQVIALDDPMLQTMFAPATFSPGSSTQTSYYVGASQKVPWHGKRALRGQVALWEASAASWDSHEVELRLAAAARMAYFDYYLVQREIELNQKNVDVMEDFRSAAKTKYEAGQVSQQDLATADLELAKLEQQRLELIQQERIAIARINTLLHQHPDQPLARSVSILPTTVELPDRTELFELAVEHRPELNALTARIQAEQNAVTLACQEYYPDFEFMGRYDAFWTDDVQRPQVGMNMNIPLNRDRRCAAVQEAQFRLTKLNAELASQQDAVREDVQIAYAKVETTGQTTKLFESRTLPAAEANLTAARAAYIAGQIDFLRVMEARRQSTEQQMAYQRSLAELHRSQADLFRAVGMTAQSNFD